jgi:hypothetical protein
MLFDYGWNHYSFLALFTNSNIVLLILGLFGLHRIFTNLLQGNE